jgi:hypothetical protein
MERKKRQSILEKVRKLSIILFILFYKIAKKLRKLWSCRYHYKSFNSNLIESGMNQNFLYVFPQFIIVVIFILLFRHVSYLKLMHIEANKLKLTSCNCHIQPLLDDFGHHLACGCKDGRTRIDRHDLCVIELEKMIRHAGLLTKREERGLFASVTQSVVKENRLDISILNPIISGSSRDLIDVAITGAMGPNNRSICCY